MYFLGTQKALHYPFPQCPFVRSINWHKWSTKGEKTTILNAATGTEDEGT